MKRLLVSVLLTLALLSSASASARQTPEWCLTFPGGCCWHQTHWIVCPVPPATVPEAGVVAGVDASFGHLPLTHERLRRRGGAW